MFGGRVGRQRLGSVSLCARSCKYSGFSPNAVGRTTAPPPLPPRTPPRLFSPHARDLSSRINTSLGMSNGRGTGCTTNICGRLFQDGLAPLLCAAKHGHADACAALLDAEADVNASDNVGR